MATETVLKFKALKKPAQLSVINSLEKVCGKNSFNFSSRSIIQQVLDY